MEPAPRQNDATTNSLTVGRIVQVQARTWPGINKPGGVGRITHLNYSPCGELTSVHVHYTVVGGREKHVPIQHVQVAPEFDVAANNNTNGSSPTQQRNQLRDRSGLLGRCKRCGSLRADCGSCDWLEQERIAQEATRAPTTQQEASAGDSRQRRRSKSKVKRKRTQLHQDEDDESLSSDDEEFLRAVNRRRRRYEKQKAYWLTAFDESASSESDQGEQPHDSSDSDDSFLIRIVQLKREKKTRRLEKKYSKATKKKKRSRRPLQVGLSSLETLAAPSQASKRDESSVPADQRGKGEPLGELPSSPEIPPKPKHPDVVVEDVGYADDSSNNSVQPPPRDDQRNKKEPSLPETSKQREVEDVGDADDSSDDGLPSPPPDDDPLAQSQFEQDDSQHVVDMAADESLDLEGLGFIQPEGEEAAEHLPSDIVDQTRSIPYKQLPAFFDELVEDLADITIPKAWAQIDAFRTETENARESRNSQAFQRQKQKGLKLYNDIQHKVIKDGIDQCREAMRRMTNSRDRRRHKKEMTKNERTQFSGLAMETRDIRLDLVVPQAEKLLREANSTLLGDFGSAAPESDVGDDEMSDSSGQGSPVSADDYELTQDLVSMNSYRSDDHRFQDGDTASLPPFDPHQHATRVRSKSTSSKRGGRQRSDARRNGHRKRRKQRNSSVSGGNHREDTDVTDLEYSEKGSRKRKRRRGSKANASEPLENDGSDDSDHDSLSSGGDSLGFESDNERRVPRHRRRSIAISRPQGNRASAGILTDERRGSNAVPAADRMQAFLDANSSNIDDFDGFSPMSDGSRENADGPSRQRQRRQTSRRNRAERMRTASDHATSSLHGDESSEDESEHVVSIEAAALSTDAFYDRLTRRRRMPESSNDSRRPTWSSFSDSCQSLLSTYSNSTGDSTSLFKSIIRHFKQQSPIAPSDATTIFDIVTQLLQKHGILTLQAVALVEAKNFRRHVRLLVFVLTLIECNVHAVLVRDDSVAFKLFASENWKKFVEAIVLQMIDVVYARVQPASWGLDSIPFPGVIEELIPLRDVASRLVHLIELSSHCILEKFPSQAWRQLDSSSTAFVSSVDPQAYKSLLLTGDTSLSVTSPGSVRFQSFKKAIPRREIETIWLLLAFFADGSTDRPCVSKFRWRLIASLVGNSAGVLSKEYFESISKDESNLPPHEDHLSRCTEELARFSALLSSAAMSPLPDSDSFLTKTVQKCLLLQVQGYRYSSDCREQDTRYILDADDRSSIAKSWKPTVLMSDNEASVQLNISTQINEITASSLPVSTLVQSCVALARVWVDLVPEKKARRSRLAQSMNTLVADCIDSASNLENLNEHSNRVNPDSSFEDVFAVSPTNLGSHYAATAYREAASRLLLVGAIGGQNGSTHSLTKQLREKVWEMISDSEMKQRQQSIISRDTAGRGTYNGQLFRLFCTARTMAWLANLHLVPLGGLEAELATGSPPGGSTVELDDDKGMLVFLASSLATCLDCACDLVEPQTNLLLGQDQQRASHFEHVSSVVACICLWLNRICIRSRVALYEPLTATTETPLLRLCTAAIELRTNLFGMLARPLKKSLLLLTNSSFHGENADVSLLSVLSLVRAVVGISSTRAEPRTNDSPVVEKASSSRQLEQPPEDDLFGSMDDELFMNIDLDIPGGGRTNSIGATASDDRDIEDFNEIWHVLADMIRLAKPSERFAILPPTGTRTTERPCMSIPGRTVASSNIGEICACLAALTCLDKQDAVTVDSSLDTFASSMKCQGWAARDDADQAYFRSVAQCFYSELCSLSVGYDKCSELVQKRWDVIVEHFVGAMLDSNTLERFPSMNLKRIKENGGVRSERKQSLRLKIANSTRQSDDPTRESVNEAGARLGRGEKANSPGPCYNSSNLWSFCENLGKVVTRRNGVSGAPILESGFDTLFLDLDSDLTSRPRDSIQLVSLEKECLKRIMLFRGILSNAASCRSMTGALNFENLSSLIIACCSYELASISKGVSYQARFGRSNANDGGTMTYKHARLLELQSCYTELTVGLLAWILRVCPSTRSPRFESTLQCVRDHLFSQILLKRTTFNIHQSLQNLYALASSGAVGANTMPRPLAAAAEIDETGVGNDVLVAIVRRSREIMVHIALDKQENGMRNVYSLLSALVNLGIESATQGGNKECFLDLIFHSMDDDNIQNALSMSRTPLQRSLDEYMRHVARDCSTSHESTALQQLRQVVLRQFLVPTLLKNDVVLSQKKGIVCMLSNVLQMEFKSQHEGLEVALVVRIVKGLSSCIRSSLESPVVDDELVCLVFQCTKNILMFPVVVSETDGSQEDTVLSWSRKAKDNDASSSNQRPPPHALYLWTYATWMNHIGKVVASRTDAHENRLEEFRSKAVSLATQGKSIWSDEKCQDALVQESLRLVSLESRVFVEKENALPVTNVYAKSKPRQTNAGLAVEEEWKPSSSVSRAANELEAKIIAVL